MLIYTVATTESAFRENMEWTGRKITPIEPPEGAMGAWLVEDRFLNAWTIHFTGTAGEYIVESKGGVPIPPFSVKVQLQGNQVGIVNAIDNGRRIQAERLLKKYCYLAAMVSDLSRFDMLKMQNPSESGTNLSCPRA